MTSDMQVLARARDDIDAFARHVVGVPLWPHQLDLARDPARIRVACCGRQSGKSRTLQLMALHEAFTKRRARVLVISAGEAAALDLLAGVVDLCSTPLLNGSVVDESHSLVTLSNGSTIRSVPASERQIRGKSVDLLIIDEAAFVAEDIWQAAKFTLVARQSSRVVLASTPWGREDRFFASAYKAGQRSEDGYSSHHWPSTVSPLVDAAFLEQLRVTMTDREWRTEVLAEWVDDQGAFFTSDELDAATTLVGHEGYEPIDPALGFRTWVDAGVDWGFANDANTLVGVGAVPEAEPFAAPGRLWVPLVVESFARSYEDFIEDIVKVGSHPNGLRFRRMSAETNGVGAMPTEVLRRRLLESSTCEEVGGVHTDQGVKERGFSALKMAMQGGRLALPRHPGLLTQLANLEYSMLDGGGMRIAVPERRGHDDLAMALCLAMTPSVNAAINWKGDQVAQVAYYAERLGR